MTMFMDFYFIIGFTDSIKTGPTLHSTLWKWSHLKHSQDRTTRAGSLGPEFHKLWSIYKVFLYLLVKSFRVAAVSFNEWLIIGSFKTLWTKLKFFVKNEPFGWYIGSS